MTFMARTLNAGFFTPITRTYAVLNVTTTSGTGSVATLAFSEPQNFVIPVGTSITTTGLSISAYNGTFTVTASTSSTVSFLSTATGNTTVAGVLTFAPSSETVPANASYVQITGWGGGGGGGYNTASTGGGGGGGAGYFKSPIMAVTGGQTISFSLGLSGTATSTTTGNGGNGGATTVSGTLPGGAISGNAPGGGGGVAASPFTGGTAGGTGSFTLAGSSTGSTLAGGSAGTAGGSGTAGNGGAAGGSGGGATTPYSAGFVDGYCPGAGGSGGNKGTNSDPRSGMGGNGVLIFAYT